MSKFIAAPSSRGQKLSTFQSSTWLHHSGSKPFNFQNLYISEFLKKKIEIKVVENANKKRNKFENLDVIEIKRKKIGQNLTKLDKNNKWLK